MVMSPLKNVELPEAEAVVNWNGNFDWAKTDFVRVVGSGAIVCASLCQFITIRQRAASDMIFTMQRWELLTIIPQTYNKRTHQQDFLKGLSKLLPQKFWQPWRFAIGAPLTLRFDCHGWPTAGESELGTKVKAGSKQRGNRK